MVRTWPPSDKAGARGAAENCLNNYRRNDNIAMMSTLADHAPPGRRFDSPAQEAWLNLWRTYDRLRAVEDALFARHGLTAQQYNALRLLRARHPEPLPTLAVAARLISRAPDITRLLDKLEERGLIARERSADNRRVVRVGITAAGLGLLKQLDGAVQECHERQLGHLAAADLRRLVGLLRAARQPHEPPESDWR
jgi:DNA-binding MarR family transcriptional regulator